MYAIHNIVDTHRDPLSASNRQLPLVLLTHIYKKPDTPHDLHLSICSRNFSTISFMISQIQWAEGRCPYDPKRSYFPYIIPQWHSNFVRKSRNEPDDKLCQVVRSRESYRHSKPTTKVNGKMNVNRRNIGTIWTVTGFTMLIH